MAKRERQKYRQEDLGTAQKGLQTLHAEADKQRKDREAAIARLMAEEAAAKEKVAAINQLLATAQQSEADLKSQRSAELQALDAQLAAIAAAIGMPPNLSQSVPEALAAPEPVPGVETQASDPVADDAADAAILGDAPQATLSINRYLDSGGNPISALRTLHFRMLRVSDAVASNAGTGMRLRPPIFDKEWPAFSRAMREWHPVAIHRTFTRLYEAEKSCKQAGAPSDAILKTLIHRIATRTL